MRLNSQASLICILVSTKNSGSADIDVTVTNPIGQTIEVQHLQISDNLYQISFHPHLSGLYQAAVTYGNIPVKASPLALGVGPVGPTPPPRAVGRGLESAQVGERASFIVTSVVKPKVQIEAVEGNVECHLQSPKPGEYIVSYTPRWVGTYDVIIGLGPNDVSCK